MCRTMNAVAFIWERKGGSKNIYLCVFAFTRRDASQNLKTNTHQKGQKVERIKENRCKNKTYIFLYHSI